MCYSKAQGGLRCESHVREELLRAYQDDFAQAERDAKVNGYSLVSDNEKSGELTVSQKTYDDATQELKGGWKVVDDNANRLAEHPDRPTAMQREHYKDPSTLDKLGFSLEGPMLVEAYYKMEDAAEKNRKIDHETSDEQLNWKIRQDIDAVVVSLPEHKKQELKAISRNRFISKEAQRRYDNYALAEAVAAGVETDPEVLRAERQPERDDLQAEYKEHRAEFNRLKNFLFTKEDFEQGNADKQELPAHVMTALEEGRRTRYPLVMEELAHERLLAKVYYATQEREMATFNLAEAKRKELEKPANRAMVQQYRKDVWSKTYDGMENQRKMNELKLQIAITPTRMKKFAQQIEDGKTAGKDMSAQEEKYQKLMNYRNNLMQKNKLEAQVEEQKKSLI